MSNQFSSPLAACLPLGPSAEAALLVQGQCVSFTRQQLELDDSLRSTLLVSAALGAPSTPPAVKIQPLTPTVNIQVNFQLLPPP